MTGEVMETSPNQTAQQELTCPTDFVVVNGSWMIGQSGDGYRFDVQVNRPMNGRTWRFRYVNTGGASVRLVPQISCLRIRP